MESHKTIYSMGKTKAVLCFTDYPSHVQTSHQMLGRNSYWLNGPLSAENSSSGNIYCNIIWRYELCLMVGASIGWHLVSIILSGDIMSTNQL